jgi:hypothetical protein
MKESERTANVVDIAICMKDNCGDKNIKKSHEIKET